MKIKDTIIVINSSHRPKDVITPKLFPKRVIDWVVAMPTDQWDDYIDHIPAVHTLAIPHNVPQCLSDQRQWVMEHFSGFKYIWLMDDDLVFLYRHEGIKLRKCSQKHIKDMFLYMREQAQQVPYVGLSARFGNNNIKKYLDLTRVYQSYIINTEVFKKVGAVFNPIPNFLGQDTHMSLCFLNAGYPTRVVGKYAFNEKSSAPGGCAVYRDADLARRCAIWLVDNHPEMTLKGKKTKTKWGLKELKDGSRFKVDYNIQWKKAYKPKKVRTSGGLSKLIKR